VACGQYLWQYPESLTLEQDANTLFQSEAPVSCILVTSPGCSPNGNLPA
jgi:hypothetical protein